MSEKLPYIGPLALETSMETTDPWTKWDLQNLIIRDLQEIHKARTDNNEASDEGVLFNYADTDEWSGYIIALPPVSAEAESALLLLSKVSRLKQPYELLNDEKVLELNDVSSSSARMELFSNFSLEEVLAIATVLSNETSKQKSDEDLDLIKPFQQKHSAELAQMEADEKALRVINFEDTENKQYLDEMTLDWALERVRLEGNREDETLQSIALKLQVSNMDYVAQISADYRGNLEAISLGAVTDTNDIDSFSIFFDGETQRLQSEPKMPLLWSKFIILDILVNGQKIQERQVESILDR